MNHTLRGLFAVAGLCLATQSVAQVTFYEREGFRGQSFNTERSIGNFDRWGFNDRASSAIVEDGRWQVCEDARFEGRCVELRPGHYDSLRAMGLNNQVSSARPLSPYVRDEYREGRRAAGGYDYRRRPNERLFEADVVAVRAVVGPPEQRCWIEREEIAQDRNGANVPGAVAGAVIGGIIGHQFGSGRGQDAATVVGALGGGAIGANVGRGDNEGYTRDVQRCAHVQGSAQPAYYDVVYRFRGDEHRVQMTTPPGRTILVNRDGEPRV
jgi:uncharacterized protein YcfJ